MLKELRIRNLVLIESLDLNFEKGLVVLTGETGAGKSVFLAALRLLGGDKGLKQQVRAGADEARVEGIFSLEGAEGALAVLQREEIESFDDEIVVERTLSASGKSRCRVNGTVVSQGVLREIGESLLQLHGQSEQLLLRDERTHAALIDLYGKSAPELAAYRSALARCREIDAKASALRKRQAELSAQEDFLRYRHDELVKAALTSPNEEEELLAKLNGVEKRGDVRHHVESARAILRLGENGMAGELRRLERELERLEAIGQLKGSARQVADARLALQELETSLEALDRDEEELSEAELDRLNGRLALLQRLKRKYSADLAGLVAMRDSIGAELASLGGFGDELADLKNEFAAGLAELREAAAALHAARSRAALELRGKVEAELAELGMGGARFAVRFADDPVPQADPGAESPLAAFPADGTDRPEFFVAVNPGEGERPLRSTLSGGELSRTMLALKSVLADVDTVPLLVFDEVDAGIAGETGNRIGEALRALGAGRQVFAVTHLHQVAALADLHLKAVKGQADGRTRTVVSALDEEGRIAELARMLGAPENAEALAHARSLREQIRARSARKS